MNINVSHIRTHIECPTKAFYLHSERRASKRRPVALDVGTLWHRSMANLLTGGFTQEQIEEDARLVIAGFKAGDPEQGDKVDKVWTSILPSLREWKMPTGWTVIEVEQVLERRYKGHVFQGTLDTVIHWNGLFWHLQHKTIAASRTLSTYAAYMERDWHECLYEWLAQSREGWQPWGGTMLNTVRKLSAKTIAADPRAALAIQFIPRPAHVVDKAVEDLVQLANQIELGNSTPQLIIQNRSACAGPYGNSLCPYIGVCNGEVSLANDELFVDVVDRYEAPVEVQNV